MLAPSTQRSQALLWQLPCKILYACTDTFPILSFSEKTQKAVTFRRISIFFSPEMCYSIFV